MTSRGNPETPLTALTRYLVADRDRTRRAALLISVSVLAAAASVCLTAVVLMLTGTTGILIGIGGTVAANLAASLRNHRRTRPR